MKAFQSIYQRLTAIGTVSPIDIVDIECLELVKKFIIN
jgi:hypothetical protein